MLSVREVSPSNTPLKLMAAGFSQSCGFGQHESW
jgi:hypothetical protein